MNSFLITQLPNRISLSQAAQITGYHQDYLGRLCRSGQIKAAKIGRNWYTTKSELQAFLADGDLSTTDNQSDLENQQSDQVSIDSVQPVISSSLTLDNSIDDSDKLPIKITRKVSTHKADHHTVQTMIARMKLENLQKNILEMVGSVGELSNRVDSHDQILARHEAMLAERPDLRTAYISGLDVSENLLKEEYLYDFERDIKKKPSVTNLEPWILQTTSWISIGLVVFIAIASLGLGLKSISKFPNSTVTYYTLPVATVPPEEKFEFTPQVAGDSVVNINEPSLSDVVTPIAPENINSSQIE